MNRELPDVQAGSRKGRGTRDLIANIRWIIEKAREFQTNIYFCFIDYAKAFDCVDHDKLWKILKEMEYLKIRGTMGTFHAKMGTMTEMVWTKQKQKILRGGGQNTQKNCTKKIFMTQIIMMV